MTAVISVQHLNKSYGRARALDDLTFTVNQGEFYGFLGPNGAGKTTAIRILTGILRADNGQVLVGGMPPDRHEAIARLIGVVPESRGFYDWMTAAEYLDFFARAYGPHEPDLVRTLLQSVDLLTKTNSRVGTFSRGMRQRLGLARALVSRPKLLFLDEPTLGLDPQGQRDIQNLFRRLNAEGVTIFLSSHLLHEVADLCSRVAVINQGKLVAEGTVAELRSKTGRKSAYRVRLAAGQSGDTIPNAGRSGHVPDAETRFADRIIRRESGATFSEVIFQGSIEEANELLDDLRVRRVKLLKFSPEEEDLTDVFLALTGAPSEARP